MSAEPRILTELRYADLSKGTQQLWLRLTDRYGVYSAVLGSESWLEKGFECDGESVPLCVRGLVPPYGAALFGAVPHDGLYTHGGYYKADGTFVAVNRATADAVYHELLVLMGIPKWRAWVRWKTLRAVGGKAWNEHLRERIAKGNEVGKH